MKNIIIYLSLIFIISCSKQSTKSINLITSNKVTTQYTNTPISLNYFDYQNNNSSEPYSLKLGSKKLNNNKYDISIFIKLFKDAHFISPNAKRDFKGKFKVVFDATDKLNLLGKLIETPLSVEEYDSHPFTNGTVNWVRNNTTYRQKIKLNSTKNFQTKGYIQFTIEPKCTLEKVPFIIKHINGELKIELLIC